MSRYLSVSGSFICSPEQVNTIKVSLQSFSKRSIEFNVSLTQAEFYYQCWHFPAGEDKGAFRYVFFGGLIIVYSEDYLLSQIFAVIKDIRNSNLEDKEIEGRFSYDEEEGPKGFWIVDSNGLYCYAIKNSRDNDYVEIGEVLEAKIVRKFTI